MSYRKYSKEDATVLEYVLEFGEEHIDEDTSKKKDFVVGDTVEIVAEGRWQGTVGVVVYTAYNMYRVEPYNEPYWNNPANICKLGLFSDAELKKIKKKPEWSTVYTGKEFEFKPSAGMKSGHELNIVMTKTNVGKSKIVIPDEAEKLRGLFSGGVGKLTSKRGKK